MAAFAHLEFHRAGIGLVPAGQPAGTPAGQVAAETAIWIRQVAGSREPLRSCNCKASRKGACEHLRQLDRALAELKRERDGRAEGAVPEARWEAAFPATIWYRLARLLQEGGAQPCGEVRVSRRRVADQGAEIRVTSASGEELARYLDPSPAQLRFLERTGKTGGDGRTFDRAGLLARLALFQLTPDEWALAKMGGKTERLSWEESFWHRLAYHCVRELGGDACTFHPAVDQESGRFTLTCRRGDQPLAEVSVPRGKVRAALALLAREFPGQRDLAIHPLPLRSIFHVTQETRFDLSEVVVRPAIAAIQASGEERYFRAAELERFRYGDLVYLRELGILAELESPGRERKFRAPIEMRLTRSQVPSLLAENSQAWEAGSLVLDGPLRHRRLLRDFDSVAIDGEALERSWYWLSIRYGFGNETISLAELLRARRGGLPFVEIGQGWIDLNAPAFGHLDRLAGRVEEEPAAPSAPAGHGPDAIRLSASELLRWQAAVGKPVSLPAAGAAELGGLLELRPALPLPPLAGLRSDLRPTSGSVSSGCASSARTGSAACSVTTWASARPTRPWRCSSPSPSSRPSRRPAWSSVRPASSVTGATSSAIMRPGCGRSSITGCSAPCRPASGPATSSSPPTACCCATPRSLPGRPSRWRSSTRCSTSRTPTPRRTRRPSGCGPTSSSA